MPYCERMFTMPGATPQSGTTNEVISLGGYVTSQSGETLAFAFVYNGRDRWPAKETIDAMGPTLAAFTR